MAKRKERKEQEEVDALLRSMGAQPQMVKRTREAAQTARFRNQARAAQYKALRQLAKKRKVSRMEDEQAKRAAPKADKRTDMEKTADKTRAEFQADVVRSVRAGSREKPERDRQAAEKARKAKEAKAAADKKAAIEAKKDKVAMMEESRRKAEERERREAMVDKSTGRKVTKRSPRLTRREKELLTSDPDKLARLEAMVGKGLISKSTRKARGPAQDEDLEEWLKGQKSWLEEDREEKRRGKRGRRKKSPKAEKKRPGSMAFWEERDRERAQAEANVRGGPKRRSEMTPGRPMSLAQFKKLPKNEQVKEAKKGLSKKQEMSWWELAELGYDAATLASAVYTMGGTAFAAWAARTAVKEIAKRKAKKEAARRAAEAAERAKVNKAAADAWARKQAKDKAEKEARKKAKDAAEKKAKDEADRKAREEANRRAREEGGRSGGQRTQSKTGSGPKKQGWQKDRDARTGRNKWNKRQQAAANKKAANWLKKNRKLSKKQLRKIYDKLNLGADRGPSAGMSIELLKRYINEAIRAGAPI